jgi:hypothetical protein
VPQQSGRKDFGVVGHEEGILREMIGKGAEHGSCLTGSFPVQNKEPGILAVAGGSLGDPGFVEFVHIGGESEIRRKDTWG